MILRLKKYKVNSFCIFLFFCCSIIIANHGVKPGYVYVIFSFIVALLLLVNSQRGRQVSYTWAYLMFIMSLWFFTPAIRRLGDLAYGWSELNIYALAPILTTSISILFLNSDLLKHPKLLKMTLAMVFGLSYSYTIGVLNNGLLPATFSLMMWLTPLIIFLFVVSNARYYEELKKALILSTMIGTLAFSIYGIYQYYFLPSWDVYWILNAPITSVGKPFPQEFRVFSLSNSPMVFAPILAMLTLLIYAVKPRMTFIVIGLSLFTLFLTFVRAAWFGFTLSLILYFLWLYRHNVIVAGKMALGAFLLSLTLLLLLTDTELGILISQRFESVFALGEDTSYQARQQFYVETLSYALFNILGDGLGAVGLSQKLAGGSSAETTFDNGVLELLITLGWIGSIFYIIPMVYFVSRAISVFRQSNDALLVSMSTIVISVFFQMIFSNRFIGPLGFFYFLILGYLIAGEIYERRYKKLLKYTS